MVFLRRTIANSLPKILFMKQNQSVESIESLGEFGLIEYLTKDFITHCNSTVKGVGDDAAVIDCGDYFRLITTDLLVEGIHFDLIYTPLRHLGYKAVTVNLSDIFAMNGKPEQITVSIALSNKISLKAIEEIYEGIRLACNAYEVDLVGGDTTTSLTGLLISITAIGTARKQEVCLRSGAQVNDVICVSGNLGASYLGLQLLEREKQIFIADPHIQPEIGKYPYCIQRQLKPEARKDVVENLKKADINPHAMIDVSDGLSSDLLHICKQSKVSCKVFEDKLPIDTETASLACELNIDPTIAAMNGGEDYELLFTIDSKELEKIAKIDGITAIGYVTSANNRPLLIARNGVEIELKAQGWNHFDK